MMKEIFVLVISLWGFNGDEWEYVGNQYVLKSDLNAAECLTLAGNWNKNNTNEYYDVQIECYNRDTKEKLTNLEYNT